MASLAVLAALGGTTSAAAAPAAGPGTDAPGERHCIVGPDGGERCFATFGAAVEAATSGRVDDLPASARAAAGDDGFRASLAGEVIQGTFFEHANYGGSSLTIYGPQPCEKDGWVNWQYDLGDGWKDSITSVQPWANCWLWLYPQPNLGGDRDGPFKENTPDIGSFMNDRTESIGFS
ncbi:hypothetical protein [Streptomyces sp. RKND-216]|uniref:hypothetical protein n=1 Tax=Streptomyces sp. RKND-216 TaxID=2562581 RepID=UPI001FFB4C0F|nr:hypothetical protein [Streptomyces sp. RKND-216]